MLNFYSSTAATEVAVVDPEGNPRTGTTFRSAAVMLNQGLAELLGSEPPKIRLTRPQCRPLERRVPIKLLTAEVTIRPVDCEDIEYLFDEQKQAADDIGMGREEFRWLLEEAFSPERQPVFLRDLIFAEAFSRAASPKPYLPFGVTKDPFHFRIVEQHYVHGKPACELPSLGYRPEELHRMLLANHWPVVGSDAFAYDPQMTNPRALGFWQYALRRILHGNMKIGKPAELQSSWDEFIDMCLEEETLILQSGSPVVDRLPTEVIDRHIPLGFDEAYRAMSGIMVDRNDHAIPKLTSIERRRLRDAVVVTAQIGIAERRMAALAAQAARLVDANMLDVPEAAADPDFRDPRTLRALKPGLRRYEAAADLMSGMLRSEFASQAEALARSAALIRSAVTAE